MYEMEVMICMNILQKNILEILTPREKLVISKRLLKDKTYQDIAKEFNVTRERIRQIEYRALEKISMQYISMQKQKISEENYKKFWKEKLKNIKHEDKILLHIDN